MHRIIAFLAIIFVVGCMPPPSYYLINGKKNKMDKQYVKVGLTDTFNTNSLTLKPEGNYEILVHRKVKGDLESGKEYKAGIYKGERVVISKLKIYDDQIYLKGFKGDEILKINNKRYRGNFYIIVKHNKFIVVNELDIENYLKGVVGREMSNTWPNETIKAQVVVARTYALKTLGKHKKDGFDLCDKQDCQVYGGCEAEYANVSQAVDETRDEVVCFGNEIASVFYHSSCGGHTENITNVWGQNGLEYLKGRRCSYCKNSPTFEWDVTIDYDDITDACRKKGYKVGDINRLKIRSYTKAGRVKELSLFWENASISVKGEEFRRLFSNILKSTMFDITNKKKGVYFSGKGLGHGIGMCQYGAKGLGEKGSSYKDIIEFYFSGTEIKKC